MKLWIGILSILVVVETTLICIYFCHKLEVSSDSPGIFVAFLGVLITFLVAWQIWQTIASREEIKEASKAAKEVESLKIEFDKRLEEVRWLAVGFYNEHLSDGEMSVSNRFWHIARTAGAYVSARVPNDFRPLDESLAEMERILESLKSKDTDTRDEALFKAHERAKLSGVRLKDFQEWQERVTTLICTESQHLANLKTRLRHIQSLYHQIAHI